MDINNVCNSTPAGSNDHNSHTVRVQYSTVQYSALQCVLNSVESHSGEREREREKAVGNARHAHCAAL